MSRPGLWSRAEQCSEANDPIGIGNADAHGKNFSLLLGATGARLAPVYDAMCTLVYPGLSPRLAMKIATKREFDEVRSEHWTSFAKAAHLAPPIVLERLRRIARELPGHARRLRANEALVAGSRILDAICASIDVRCGQVEKR